MGSALVFGLREYKCGGCYRERNYRAFPLHFLSARLVLLLTVAAIAAVGAVIVVVITVAARSGFCCCCCCRSSWLQSGYSTLLQLLLVELPAVLAFVVQVVLVGSSLGAIAIVVVTRISHTYYLLSTKPEPASSGSPTGPNP